ISSLRLFELLGCVFHNARWRLELRGSRRLDRRWWWRSGYGDMHLGHHDSGSLPFTAKSHELADPRAKGAEGRDEEPEPPKGATWKEFHYGKRNKNETEAAEDAPPCSFQ